jgi:hypothetical protein
VSTSLITSLSTYIHTCISVSTTETVNEIKEIVKNGLPTATTITLPVAVTANSVSSIYTVYDAPKPGRENHPLIKFWYKRDYLQLENVKKKTAAVLDPTLAKQPAPRGSTRLAHGNENVATDYIIRKMGISFCFLVLLFPSFFPLFPPLHSVWTSQRTAKGVLWLLWSKGAKGSRGCFLRLYYLFLT